MTIEGSACNPWQISKPDVSGRSGDLIWLVQVTAPIPLEAISDLFVKGLADTPSALLPYTGARKNKVAVTKDFFQSTPNGISKDNVDDQVLGFFSLILSYAKAAKNMQTDESVKTLTSIMPRTEFITIFAQVKDKISLDPKSLYDLVKILACYQNEEDNDYS